MPPIRRLAARILIGLFIATMPTFTPAVAAVVRVGSKSFTESYILAEIAAQITEHAGETTVERKLGLGGTGIVYTALVNGEIDVYPEYTGTISRTILKDASATSVDAIRARLRPLGLTISDALGFDNTYALAVRRELAARLGLAKISDLRRHPGLSAAFDPGFLEREDGWSGLRRHYSLELRDVRIMEHALTYRALMAGAVDVVDVFSTDGQLARLDLAVLADDRRFFPDYAAVLLARRSLPERFPRTWGELGRRLAGRIDNKTMARLNAQADLDGQGFAQVAATFLGQPPPSESVRPPGGDLMKLTLEHLYLVVVSLVVAVAVGIPLAILAARHPLLAQLELIGVGLIQTIPALALLSFMIPLFGIGKVPALVALCLYALLPIVRNTYTGLRSLDPQLLDMAAVMGLTGWQRLGWIELPLASMTITAGIKTSAVLTVGTATLAAFIGGGGYGTLIVTGLALNDLRTILSGAIPAAAMALAVHGIFEAIDALVVPRVLRFRKDTAA
jgi:osmoprotectant transport system permease protein